MTDVVRTSAGAPPRFAVPNLRSAAFAVLGLALGAAAWQWVGNHTQPSSFVSFTETIHALVHLTRNGELIHALVSSLKLFAAGLAIALVLGFFFGLVLARVRLLRVGLEPYIAAFYATPMVALIPYILAIFGFAFRAKLIVVVLFGLWPILINTLEGARSVNEELLEVARSYRSTEPKLWTHVVIPYTLPFTMTGVRQSIARCLVGMIASEFLLSSSGLGNLIIINTQRFETANVLAAVLTVTLLATALMAVGRAIENHFARWRSGA